MQHDDIVRAALDRIVAALEEASDDLDGLDAVASDGNHGQHMVSGATAARDAAVGAPAGSALSAAAEAWRTGAGFSNPLWGTVLGAAASVERQGPVAMIDAALSALHGMTDANVGDKSVVDTLVPALDDARDHLVRGETVTVAAARAADIAEEAALETAALEARFDASNPDIGYPDPGATSSAVILGALAATIAELSDDADA
ncbi:DAK2 domain-containing protein [Agrococcus sp. TF02-05]|uniref:DAK2 domain-containing protein n=1 Tax=Agrococcus sp. TF02-05 TaxID=2815211 RepID=UPI001AA1B6C6|nr:DAK2 domain-containing protein [Agrococcus sp. TF02-05]MBO1769401.1 DAK2 domain-containing protein [Agrococcus sp. TF02-05]